MAKTCFVCGNRIGLFSSYAVTKDKKYICVEDANYYFGENPDDNKIPFALKKGLIIKFDYNIIFIINYKKQWFTS